MTSRRADADELRTVAVRAVASAMAVVADRRGQGADLGVRAIDSVSEYDRYVTALDEEAEAAVLDVLRSADPTTPVVGETAGGEIGAERVWVVDPIDGTTNLVRGEPFVAVTLALLERGRPLAAATGCPFTGELWSAVRGDGAYDRDGRRLQVRDRPLAARRVALDPATPPAGQQKIWTSVHAAAAEVSAEVAPRASIALALAYVAAGIFDGFVQLGGSPIQDFAAGMLLVSEAGGMVSGVDGSAAPWCSDLVVAGSPQTYSDLRAALEPFRTWS